MTAPTTVSRKAYQEFDGTRWNAMIDLLALSELQDMTPIQRRAHLSFWYMTEVYNGGHWQYFCNKADYDHQEVIDSFHALGAGEHAEILTQALTRLPNDVRWPETVKEFIAGYDAVNMQDLDEAFGECARKIEDFLEVYLDRYESEFIEWIP